MKYPVRIKNAVGGFDISFSHDSIIDIERSSSGLKVMVNYNNSTLTFFPGGNTSPEKKQLIEDDFMLQLDIIKNISKNEIKNF